jgi:alkylated DNA repair dioxygenase AlkB
MTRELALESALGLKYWSEFVSKHEEERLVAYAEAQSHWTRFGKLKRRLAFGYVYGVSTRTIVRAAPPIPPLLELLAVRLVENNMMKTIADQVVVQEYPPGVGIGEHVDAPVFGPEVCSVSLLSRCVMRFRHVAGDLPAIAHVLEPRSGLAMTGSSRTDWSHHIDGASVVGRRLSITFRTVARNPQT